MAIIDDLGHEIGVPGYLAKIGGNEVRADLDDDIKRRAASATEV